MVEPAPSSVDLQDFQFKLHSKCKIFNNADDSKFKNSYSLITAASRYGLIFIGSADASLEVIQLNTLQNIEHTNVKTESNCAKRSIPLFSKATHLALNCDSTLLAVVCGKNDCATALIYNVPSFLSQNVSIVREIRLSATPGVNVLETNWNPTISTILTACKADGSLGVYNIQENSVDINELPVAASAKCFCWSPKGKQLVVGDANGSLTQYKPDLKAVKVIQAPALNGKGPFHVVNVFWLTNYQFLAIYKDGGDAEARPMILIVNAPKVGNITYINYEDICYSYGNLRLPQYYIIHQPTWGVLLVASANSMEVGVLGVSQPGEPALWQQWNQIDAARAELPLSANHQETFPIGFSFDTGITMQLPWGENQTLPSMPMIHILSHHGVLCSFSVINLKQGAVNLCSPPEPVADQSGLNQFIVQQLSAPNVPTSSAMLKTEIPASKLTLTEAPVPVPAPVNTTTPSSAELPKPATQPPPFEVAKSSNQYGTDPQQNAFPAATFAGSGPFLYGAAPTSSFNPPYVPPSGPEFAAPVSVSTSATSTLHPPSSALFNSTNTSTSMLGAIGTPNFNASVSKATMFGMTMTTTPSFGSFSSKITTPSNTLSMTNSSLNNITTPSSMPQTSTSFNNSSSKPTSQPLLATPKVETLIQKPAAASSKSDLTDNQSDATIQLASTSSETFAISKDDSVIKDQMIQSLIKDEVKTFHGELQELFFRCKHINLNVGTEEEKSSIVLKTEALLEFYRELKDTTDSQVSEVYYLKQALMQSFAWYEDTKARHKRYTDPNFASLLQAQELDPVSEKQMADIKHLIYYIEAQLKQIDSFLDNQWADFQDSCKKHIKGKLHIPTLEPIYQSLVRQNAILERQKYMLKDIGARIKSRNKKSANYPHVMNKLNVSATNKENFHLYEEFRNLLIEGDVFQSRYEKIAANEKKFTETKQSKLCAFFSNRNVSHIAPRKPKFISNIFQVSPAKFNAKSYTSPRSVNRSLRSTFDSIAHQASFDTSINTNVEANLSSSNLFSFTLLDGAHGTRLRTPEKEPQIKSKADLLFHTPTSSEHHPNQMPKMFINPLAKLQATANSAPTSSSIFNFTASSTAVTQSKQQNITYSTAAPNFTFDQSKFADGGKTSVSNTTFFSFSSPNASPLQNKQTEMQMPESTTATTTTTFIKSPTSETTTFLSGLSTGDSKSIQSFNFIAPKTSLPKNIFKGAGDSGGTPRDSLDAGFNFGLIDLGQQSTPKPKSSTTAAAAAASTAPSSIFNQMSTSSIITQSSTAASIPKTGTSDAAVKPSFSFQTSNSQAPVDSTASQYQLPGVTITPISKSEMNPATTTTAPIFGGLATKPVTTTVSSFFGPAAAAVSTPSAFGFSQTSIFDNNSSTELAKSTTVSTTSIASSAPTVSSTPSITVILPASTGTPATTFSFTQLTSTAPAKTTSLFESTATTTTTTATATTTASSIFGSSSATPTSPITNSSFSFVKPTASATGTAPIFGATSTTMTETSKSGSIFGTATTTPVETSKTDSIFATGFAALAVTTNQSTTFGFASPTTTTTTTTTTESNFSFGQLTVSALSPNASANSVATTTTGTTAATASTFSFALAASNTAATMPATTTTATLTTSSTTSGTSVFGGFGSSNDFGKPATTTTASSFMGQPICSPSAFSQSQQSTGSIFGQAAGNVFAQKASTGASGGSIFGQSGGSLFGSSTGNSTAATSSSSIFGQTQSSPFGSPAQSTTSSGGSIFGQTPAFNSTAATTANSGFGQSSFGGAAATPASSNFSFTQSAANTGFGNSSGNIFGTKPTFGATSAFGQPPAFGSPPAFGATPTSASVFGAPSQANNPGSFGSGFGTPSVFGQKPAFGSPPSFGQTAFASSPSAFGTASTFGSPNRVFGVGASPVADNFGGATVQENSTFANLANQPTLGFGSLVQNQTPSTPQPQPPQFSGGAQFSSWR